jgi:hypothetical protein
MFPDAGSKLERKPIDPSEEAQSLKVIPLVTQRDK